MKKLKENKTLLEKLIDCLKVISSSPPNEELDSIIDKIQLENQKKNDDDLAASYILTIISIMPDIMHHPKNEQLKKFCKQLNPSTIYLTPLIWDKLLENTPQNLEQAPIQRRLPKPPNA
ncbi:MAG: hypothetical protein KIT56_08955 [Gammaproteobacteria bacterium]|nr:hypothetical protein [Gammaproteobacteria bacterium]MCW5583985.1 hypothetical protein [Gammaproteobacteria bacterium]